MDTILVIIHLFLAMGLIGLILIQHGKGADAGAAFGSGASATVFGASGSANFLSRATGVLALLFFVTSLALAWSAMNSAKDAGLMMSEPVPQAPEITEVVEISDIPDVPMVGAETDVPAIVDEQVVEETVEVSAPVEEQKAAEPATAQ